MLQQQRLDLSLVENQYQLERLKEISHYWADGEFHYGAQ